MARPTGKTLFTVGLLTVPMRIFSATKEHDTRFHLHHDRCLSRIQQKKWCPACNTSLKQDELVRGVEVGDGAVTFTEQELDALPLPSRGGLDALADESDAALEELIAAKAAGQMLNAPAAPAAPAEDLVAAIKRSLAAAGVAV